MTFIPAGEARLDFFTDSLILNIREDTFVVPLDRLADLVSHRTGSVRLSRRYYGDPPGKYIDIEQGVWLRRSRTGRALVATIGDNVYSVPIWAVRGVVNGIRDVCRISQLVTDARQLDDGVSRQTTLGVGT